MSSTHGLSAQHDPTSKGQKPQLIYIGCLTKSILINDFSGKRDYEVV